MNGKGKKTLIIIVIVMASLVVIAILLRRGGQSNNQRVDIVKDKIFYAHLMGESLEELLANWGEPTSTNKDEKSTIYTYKTSDGYSVYFYYSSSDRVIGGVSKAVDCWSGDQIEREKIDLSIELENAGFEVNGNVIFYMKKPIGFFEIESRDFQPYYSVLIILRYKGLEE